MRFAVESQIWLFWVLIERNGRKAACWNGPDFTVYDEVVFTLFLDQLLNTLSETPNRISPQIECMREFFQCVSARKVNFNINQIEGLEYGEPQALKKGVSGH